MEEPDIIKLRKDPMEISKYSERIRSYEEGFWPDNSPLLGHLDIELTERCDNNCIHCSINIPENDPKKEKELNTSEWKRIIREAADLGVLSIRFTGGEPLLREDFSELYLFTRKSGIKVIIFTNARKITPDLARLLTEIPPLEKIEVSVYGMKRSTYEKVSRIPGSYREFRSGIDLLLKYNIPFLVKGVLLPETRSEIKEFESWASTLPGMDGPPSYSMNFELRERRDSEARNKLISSLRNTPQEGIDLLSGKNEDYFSSMSQFCSQFIGPPGPELFNCGAGTSGSVDAYGNYNPCLTLKAGELSYDLTNGTLKDALLNFFPEKLKIEAKNREYLNRCAKCFLKGLCLQCPARSWSEHGNFDTPVEYLCQAAHAEAVHLGLLNNNEKGWEVVDWEERIKKMEDKINVKN